MHIMCVDDGSGYCLENGVALGVDNLKWKVKPVSILKKHVAGKYIGVWFVCSRSTCRLELAMNQCWVINSNLV